MQQYPIYNIFMNQKYYRIIDANINRACEGLRVVEDYLRFISENEQYSKSIKQHRHKLRQIGIDLGTDNLLNVRASDIDIGKNIPSPSERNKTNPNAIITASFKRIQEALRTIEEYSIPIDSKISKQAAELRFEIYQLEQQIFAASYHNRFLSVKLYLLIGSDVCPINKIETLACELLDAGVDCLQLREKKLSDKQFFELAEKLSRAAHQRNKLFIVNDRPDIAIACGADGVHIGQDDIPVSVISNIINPNQIIGVSTHNMSQLEQAIAQHPTYIAIGPAFNTQTKPREPPSGLDFIKSAIRRLQQANIPEIVIGGINLSNLETLLSLGVKRVALCSAIISSRNPVEVTKSVIQKLAR